MSQRRANGTECSQEDTSKHGFFLLYITSICVQIPTFTNVRSQRLARASEVAIGTNACALRVSVNTVQQTTDVCLADTANTVSEDTFISKGVKPVGIKWQDRSQNDCSRVLGICRRYPTLKYRTRLCHLPPRPFLRTVSHRQTLDASLRWTIVSCLRSSSLMYQVVHASMSFDLIRQKEAINIRKARKERHKRKERR
ncbi:hypothetical protein PENSPDRAFT_240819 [Peniophora sp. CONT]|nr:hypothetical protein PENSPDRAFT_240819 [Peniophora sp. CONT]